MYSYEEFNNFLRMNNAICPVSSTNENGEMVIFERGRNAEGEWIELQTVQHNNWIRKNRFYKSGIITEEYER